MRLAAGLWAPAQHLALHLVEVLDPDLPQDFHLWQGSQTPGRVPAEDHLEQARAVGADPLPDLGTLGPCLGKPGVLGAGGVVPEPVRFRDTRQPVRGSPGESVERRPQRLRDHLQPAHLPSRRQHVCGVGPGSACGLQQPFLAGGDQDAVQHAQPGVRLNQPVPELREHGEVEARITQIQAEGVLEVDPGPDRFRGLPVGQALDELQHQDQRQAAR